MLTLEQRFNRRIIMAERMNPDEIHGLFVLLQSDYGDERIDAALETLEAENVRLKWGTDIDRHLRRQLGPPRPLGDRRALTTPANDSGVLGRTEKPALKPGGTWSAYNIEIAPGEWVPFDKAFQTDYVPKNRSAA
jgi:hypothetical protein